MAKFFPLMMALALSACVQDSTAPLEYQEDTAVQGSNTSPDIGESPDTGEHARIQPDAATEADAGMEVPDALTEPDANPQPDAIPKMDAGEEPDAMVQSDATQTDPEDAALEPDANPEDVRIACDVDNPCPRLPGEGACINPQCRGGFCDYNPQIVFTYCIVCNDDTDCNRNFCNGGEVVTPTGCNDSGYCDQESVACPEAQACNTDTFECEVAECEQDADCEGSAFGEVCDEGECVACNGRRGCAEDEFCNLQERACEPQGEEPISCQNDWDCPMHLVESPCAIPTCGADNICVPTAQQYMFCVACEQDADCQEHPAICAGNGELSVPDQCGPIGMCNYSVIDCAQSGMTCRHPSRENLNNRECIPIDLAEREERQTCFDGEDNDGDGVSDQVDPDCDGFCHPGSGECDDGDFRTEDWCHPQTWTCRNEVVDRDGDLVDDQWDACPDEYGFPSIDGCRPFITLIFSWDAINNPQIPAEVDTLWLNVSCHAENGQIEADGALLSHELPQAFQMEHVQAFLPVSQEQWADISYCDITLHGNCGDEWNCWQTPSWNGEEEGQGELSVRIHGNVLRDASIINTIGAETGTPHWHWTKWTPECTEHEHMLGCFDGTDDDCDGLVDGDDPDCLNVCDPRDIDSCNEGFACNEETWNCDQNSMDRLNVIWEPSGDRQRRFSPVTGPSREAFDGFPDDVEFLNITIDCFHSVAGQSEFLEEASAHFTEFHLDGQSIRVSYPIPEAVAQRVSYCDILIQGQCGDLVNCWQTPSSDNDGFTVYGNVSVSWNNEEPQLLLDFYSERVGPHWHWTTN